MKNHLTGPGERHTEQKSQVEVGGEMTVLAWHRPRKSFIRGLVLGLPPQIYTRRNNVPEDDIPEDFKYIVRLANTDIDGHRPVKLALTSIKGIGRRTAQGVLARAQVDPNKRIGETTDKEEEALKAAVESIVEDLPVWMLNRQQDYDTGDDLHIVGTEVEMTRKDDINRLKKIRCYRGIRHETGHKVRGQRTKANGRSGLTLGVSRKK